MAGRIIVSYPFVFNSLSGVQPASELDSNFNQVDLGTITIGAQILYASTTLLAKDSDYNFLLCLPTNNMNITMPGSMPTWFSFWVSNQSSNKTVTLLGSWTIDGLPFINPILPGSFGSLSNVIGGFAVFDGATLRLFPKLFM
jgi:hypothetical protein